MINSGPLSIKDLEAAMAAITNNFGVPTQFLMPPACADFLKPCFQQVRCVFDGRMRLIPSFDTPSQYRHMPLDFYRPDRNVYTEGF